MTIGLGFGFREFFASFLYCDQFTHIGISFLCVCIYFVFFGRGDAVYCMERLKSDLSCVERDIAHSLLMFNFLVILRNS